MFDLDQSIELLHNLQVLEALYTFTAFVRDVRTYYVPLTQEELTEEIARLLHRPVSDIARLIPFALTILESEARGKADGIRL